MALAPLSPGVPFVDGMVGSELPAGTLPVKKAPALSARFVEEVPSTIRLSVGGVLHLEPFGLPRVGISLPLGHDAFEVQPLDSFEQLAPVLLDRKHARKRRVVGRDQSLQSTLAPTKGCSRRSRPFSHRRSKAT